MKINTLLLFTAGLLLTSCFKDPNFPDNPVLKSMNLSYKEIGGLQEDDSLIISLDFQDGDGDLGFDASDESHISSPFNEFAFFSYNTNTQRKTVFALDTLTSASDSDLALVENMITVSDRAIPELDTLPPYDFPYTCNNWQEVNITAGNTVLKEDTVYYQKNPRYNNIYVNFFLENSGGEFEEFFWEYLQKPQCNIAYHGRFPIINEVGRETASEGIITYRIPNKGWESTFGNKRFKVRVTILDRAGNYSNAITSEPVTLDDIKIN
ncbi:hypothetical protein JMN32_18500 [Fulvivirga sp. 29W222]|uniref:Uncharacterized protein n=1 Tax=Fulvivirga marina TaxID=2494733 RepID=A0A937G183_9BACT|nr:hypothetical protein [Fulvivirga marina]MBL6448311.1 hypothetical protein [Fulvivirga marina]